MNTYISIFPNTDPTLKSKICIGGNDIEAETKEDAALQSQPAVPFGWPFLVFLKSEYDNKFHNAYEPDWSNPDGKGNNQKMRNNFLAMGYTEEF